MSTTDVKSPQPVAEDFVNAIDGPFIRFPPFPTAPEGTTVMSFKKFKEKGICVEPGPEEAEVDALGIPTVPLRVRHETDQCKMHTKRKRQAEDAKAHKKGGKPSQGLWWERWEDGEAIRFSIGFNPQSSHFERIHAAAVDFTNGRTWPVNLASKSNPRFIWEEFQRYIGLPEGGPTPQEKKKAQAKKDEDDDSDISDDDMDDADEISDNPGPSASMAGIITDQQLPALTANNKAAATNEEKLVTFFNNTETSIKVFMSSYAQVKGYIWEAANLECIPRILGFFVNFLLRSKVLPEIERNLRRSLDVIAAALIELPNTARIAKAFPDKLSLACSACWGKKANGYSMVVIDTPTESDGRPSDTSDPQAEKKEKAGRDGKQDTTPEKPWSSANNDSRAWANSAQDSSNDANACGIISESLEADSWTDIKQENLLDFLGPTALPLTHTTGIVERSMRQIKSISGPSLNPPKSAAQGEGVFEPDADAVEVELDRQFTKVVLSPMTDWDGGEFPVYSRPTVLETSQGPVVQAGTPEVAEGTTPKPHDPLKDEITILVETKEQVSFLREGMALGGTWVQLVRQGEGAKKKKRKGKSKKSIPSYWYLDEWPIVTPSFWTVVS
ncbi:hypothetical protein BDZ97DRAFT_2079684 [Flammula alnicola]|nr:hypothetical protein BDZ97DRAFT_2079684 [Flammula alnicola]